MSASVFFFLITRYYRFLLSQLPSETLAEAKRMAAASTSSGVLNTSTANPRWLPDAERVRKVLRSATTAHRLHADEQRSLLELLDKYEIDANDNGSVIFSQPQQCYCYEVDVEEQRLALQRRRTKVNRDIELLTIQQRALGAAAAQEVSARLKLAQDALADIDRDLAALGDEVRFAHEYFTVCLTYLLVCSVVLACVLILPLASYTHSRLQARRRRPRSANRASTRIAGVSHSLRW